MLGRIDKRPTPWSRLTIIGTYTLDTPVRIGMEQRVFEQMRDRESSVPVIPAATIRGALRSAVGSIARSWAPQLVPQTCTVSVSGAGGNPQSIMRQVVLACDPALKRSDDLNYQGCLTEAIVGRWQTDQVLRSALKETLFACTCAVCRLFGTPWLAGRVLVNDLIPGGVSAATFISGGGRNGKLIFPSGTHFRFSLRLEQANYAEQGLMLVGLYAFIQGQMTLGADRVRGFGQGHLMIDWPACRYWEADSLLRALQSRSAQGVPFTEDEADRRIQALDRWLSGMTRPDAPSYERRID